MTLKRFHALLELHGADFRRWPSEERAHAEALTASPGKARRAWQQACDLDALLDRAAPAVSEAAATRVLCRISAEINRRAPAVPAEIPAIAPVAVPLWPTAGLFAALGLAGFLIGRIGPFAGSADTALAYALLPQPSMLVFFGQ